MKLSKKSSNKNKIISIIQKFFDIEKIEATARATNFVQRKRKLGSVIFFFQCVFAYQKEGTHSLEDYCKEAFKEGISIRKQSLQGRFNVYAVEFMKSMVAYALSIKLRVGEVNTRLKFGRIIIGDSTIFQLPPKFSNKYRGSGGGASQAAVKVQYCYDLLSQQIIDVSVLEGIIPDCSYALQDIQKGDLRIEDLGYFRLQRLRDIHDAEAFFLSRLKFGIKIYVLKDGIYKSFDLLKEVKKMKQGIITSAEVYIGEKEKFPVRLVLEKVSVEIANDKRRRLKTDKQNKRKAISKERLVFCDVNAFITNCNEEQLPNSLIRQCYSLRWQIEIIFKAWKSIFKIDKVKDMKLERFECLHYGCLMLIITSTNLLMFYKQRYLKKYNKEVSELKFYKLIANLHEELKMVLKKTKPKISILMEQIDLMIERFCIKEQKKNRLKPLKILTNLSLT